jgi:hypothetical protein
MVAMTLGRIPPLHCGTSSSPHLPSSPWTEMPSSSKCRGFSLAFARGLRWWKMAVAHLDLFSRATAVVADAGQENLRSRSIPIDANEENDKP